MSKQIDRLIDTAEYFAGSHVDERSYYLYMEQKRLWEISETLWRDEIKDNLFTLEDGTVIDGQDIIYH